VRLTRQESTITLHYRGLGPTSFDTQSFARLQRCYLCDIRRDQSTGYMSEPSLALPSCLNMASGIALQEPPSRSHDLESTSRDPDNDTTVCSLISARASNV
jgi:hypothetical protein